MSEPVKTIKGQVKVAPQPRPETLGRMEATEAREYLESAGWKHAGTNDKGETLWSDPAGMGPRTGVKVPGATLPNKDGGEATVIMQTRCAPSSWDYSMQEAVNMQRIRDRAAEAKAS